jgi:hypothetical protein
MIPDDQKKRFATKALDALVAAGCVESKARIGLHRFVYFDGAGMKPPTRKDDVAKLCRAIRQATLCERNSILVADIDRMGKVIGWHSSSNP